MSTVTANTRPSLLITVDAHTPVRPESRSDYVRLTAVLFVALIQGLLYLFLLPPWQHYDEPTQFEYAWLIANHGRLPVRGTVDYTLRRELTASMLEHGFYARMAAPSFLTDDGQIGIGYSQLANPPVYYTLVSLPLRLVRHLDITTQLFIARSVSLLLFLLTIAMSFGIMCELTPPGHSLRWAVPLSMALLPAFADIMTAVNSDVGATLVFTLFLWGSVRTIRLGLTWRRMAWVIGVAILAVFTKNTAAVAILFAPLTILIALWVQHGWRWRWFTAAMLGLSVLLVLTLFNGGGVAYWYQWDNLPTQIEANRIADPVAPLGTHVLHLQAEPEARSRRLANPLLFPDIDRIAGETVTFGGWIWADRPVQLATPGLAVYVGRAALPDMVTHSVSVTTTPTFVAWTVTLPENIQRLHYVLTASISSNDEQSLQLFFDGAVLAHGTYPTDVPPVFDDARGMTGLWGGQKFTNLVRNPSAMQAWPRVRSRLSAVIVSYIQRSPSTFLAALCDVERTGQMLWRYVRLVPFDSFFTVFAWGHVRLSHPVWTYLYRGMLLFALSGGIIWFFRCWMHKPVAVRAVFFFFMLTVLAIWLNTFLRPLPFIDGSFVLPIARYAFPAIVPTMLVLVGGWWALWPGSQRNYAVVAFVAGMFIWNAAAIRVIWLFYYVLPS